MCVNQDRQANIFWSIINKINIRKYAYFQMLIFFCNNGGEETSYIGEHIFALENREPIR